MKPSQNPDDLLEHPNSHHPTIVFTVEENPDHFLDTSFTYVNKFNCKVYKKPGKLPTHWKSEIPTKCKRNGITGARPQSRNAFLLILTTISKQFKQPF